MTYKTGNKVVIEVEDESRCELCGKIEELRPYGPNGERICFTCGMKDEKSCKQAFGELIHGKIQ